MFHFKAFLVQPIIDQFNKLLKDDLLELADRFGIIFQRPTLTDEVKTVVLQKPIELDFLSVPKPSPEKEEVLPDQTVSSQPNKSSVFRSVKTDERFPQPEKTKIDSSSLKDERECY